MMRTLNPKSASVEGTTRLDCVFDPNPNLNPNPHWRLDCVFELTKIHAEIPVLKEALELAREKIISSKVNLDQDRLKIDSTTT